MTHRIAGTALALALLAGDAEAEGLSKRLAPAGRVVYKEWLGRTFSEVLLN